MPDESAASIWRLNHRVLTSVLNDCLTEFEALGLEPKEFFVLAEVDECRYPAALATRLATPKASVTVYLKTLEAAGLIRREIDKDDLRRHRLVLTTRGNVTLHQAQAILANSFQESLAALNAGERSEFQRLLEKVLRQRPTPPPTAATLHPRQPTTTPHRPGRHARMGRI